MKDKFVFIFIFLLCILFISSSSAAYAINFTPEDEYNSVVVVYTPSGVGSGFTVSDNTIVTNAHVVGSYKDVIIKLYSGEEINGNVIKVDENKDLAAIHINKTIQTIEFSTEVASVGSEVYAIGAPKDMPYTLTKGIVSAVNRKIGNNTYIQLDASVNEGNSGGPLVDESGKVLGVITLKASNAEGIGFAIKADDVNDFLNGIITEHVTDVPKNKSNERNDDNISQIEEMNKNLITENNYLKIAVCVLGLSSIILLFLCIKLYGNNKKTTKKPKDEFDFEIEIEE